MSLTSSRMLDLGTRAPYFKLPDVRGQRDYSVSDFNDKKGLLVMFICRHCPYVKFIKEELGRLDRDYAGGNVALVAISSNDASTYPDDSPDSLARFAAEEGYSFPLLYDESQQTARAFGAECTPDFFLFDQNRELVYRGQLDDSRPGNSIPVDGRDLRAALDALLAGTAIPADQKASIGCNIKWKPGPAASGSTTP